MEEIGVPGENHRPVASHWQTLSHTADLFGVFILCQHFEISYSRNANQHIIIGVYITINANYRCANSWWFWTRRSHSKILEWLCIEKCYQKSKFNMSTFFLPFNTYFVNVGIGWMNIFTFKIDCGLGVHWSLPVSRRVWSSNQNS